MDTPYTLDEGQRRCVTMGTAACRAVTCTTDGATCTLRASPVMEPSPTDEVTHVPSAACAREGAHAEGDAVLQCQNDRCRPTVPTALSPDTPELQLPMRLDFALGNTAFMHLNPSSQVQLDHPPTMSDHFPIEVSFSAGSAGRMGRSRPRSIFEARNEEDSAAAAHGHGMAVAMLVVLVAGFNAWLCTRAVEDAVASNGHARRGRYL